MAQLSTLHMKNIQLRFLSPDITQWSVLINSKLLCYLQQNQAKLLRGHLLVILHDSYKKNCFHVNTLKTICLVFNCSFVRLEQSSHVEDVH